MIRDGTILISECSNPSWYVTITCSTLIQLWWGWALSVHIIFKWIKDNISSDAASSRRLCAEINGSSSVSRKRLRQPTFHMSIDEFVVFVSKLHQTDGTKGFTNIEDDYFRRQMCFILEGEWKQVSHFEASIYVKNSSVRIWRRWFGGQPPCWNSTHPRGALTFFTWVRWASTGRGLVGVWPPCGPDWSQSSIQTRSEGIDCFYRLWSRLHGGGMLL